ncbi:MAG TPA: hypothetical protein DEB73_01610 [Candidatus Magasanikbacteria bacterium]|uniref:Uncharacterized protein n=2 Tax=Candidatus Magasanikiibacteriota TaxID=1752731 RepID=A0A0G0ZJY6_9BACT|nr:MAG: hypothetical protein UU49_C0002G0003 [Candidatus Magasanikbacteria bacterium GW2011_GWC2_41_17]KKS13268.1 MAG: hypothetical protein UU69_C0009G0003 [Candidatus Magasanikbacteria bacterium GW2011_GWA2_41_55]HBV57943.1 hypothetical protein [Candidatus Magasanikbacteria bacterium]HBX15705.1 hypothetical protein [Candidatus Magasanikbacteria bacterium]
MSITSETSSVVPDNVLEKAREIAGPCSELWIPNRKMISPLVMVWGLNPIWFSVPCSERWVFFCDDDPGALWEHSCRLLLITDELDLEIRSVDVPPKGLTVDWTKDDSPESIEGVDDAWAE